MHFKSDQLMNHRSWYKSLSDCRTMLVVIVSGCKCLLLLIVFVTLLSRARVVLNCACRFMIIIHLL